MVTERLKRQNERLLDEAENAVASLDWDVVRDRALAVLAFDPDNPDAREFLSAAQRAIGSTHPATPRVILEEPPSAPAPAPAAPPQSPRIPTERYQLKQLLSQDDRKQVFVATDSLQDRDVAFTLINAQGMDEASRSRIKRESLALARLGSNAHIVTVLHVGDHPSPVSGQATQPFIATELMEGGNLQELIQHAPQHRLPIEQTVNIARGICRGLDFAHSGGIVHGDLKPGNVWLTSDEVAKIADFGLDLTVGGTNTASLSASAVSYMAPEKALGEEVSPRSDLYSLGAILYEMVTGRPPFLGEDADAVINHHANTPPLDPSSHNPDCPLALQALIMRLLAKEPAERPASAAEVLSALEALDSALAAGTAHTTDDDLGLDTNVFVDRQREMGELKTALELALHGQGSLVFLSGEPGIGKSRTTQELATYAALRGAQVLWGSCYPEETSPPYSPWAQAIRSYIREKDPEQLLSDMGAGVVADIAELVHEIRDLLPDLSPAPHMDSPEQARSRFFNSISSFFKTVSQKQPLVLVLDDLHWADLPSVLLLQSVSKALGTARMLVVGTYHDTEISRQHPLAEPLKELTREKLVLRGLTEEDVGHLIEVATRIVPSPSLVRAVYTQTEGNPLFATEVLRQLVHEGGLSRERAVEGESWTVRINEGLGEVIWRRLNRLSGPCKEALTTASFLGRSFTVDQLRPLIEDLTPDQLLEALEEALEAGVIQEVPGEAGWFQFPHTMIQESLNREMPDTGRVLLHARIAQALEELYGPEVDIHASELAYHFGQAEPVLGKDRIGRYSLLAGEQALVMHAWETALGHFRRALAAKEGQPTDGETAAILFGLARAMCATVDKFQLSEIVAHLTRVFRYFEQSGVISGRAMLGLHRETT